MTVVVGADEAGKGPVLGPMVAAAVRADPAVLPPVDDSKRLSADRRETIAGELRASAGAGDLAWAVGIVPTEAIDDPETDMNRLTVAAQVAALRPVTDEARVIVDAGDTDADRFGRRVRAGLTDGEADDRIAVETGGDTACFPDPTDVHATHGADEKHAIVGAASVLAKTVRDRRMARVGDRYDRPVGSGYPSDETTRTFLREYVRDHGELPPCARSSWATARDAIAAAEQSQLDGF